MNPPSTSITLLRELGANAASPRWSELVADYRPALESYLAASFPVLADEKDDLLQETFIAVVKRLPSYHYDPDEKGHFRNYLLGILRHKACDALRSRSRERDRLRKEPDPGPPAAAESEAEAREWLHSAYEVALSQFLADPSVQERTKQVFLRVAVDGEKPDRVAAAYGLSRNAVDQIKNRATRRLRDLAAALVSAT